MTPSQPSSRDIPRKLVALIFGPNFFGALIIFLYFSVIDPAPVRWERRFADLKPRTS
jgi:hypothetical protein